MDNGKIRCPWAESSSLMQAYHDSEWGRICHDDQYLFEMLTLEGAQAGLSWQSICSEGKGTGRHSIAFRYIRWRK